jgi:23S rRNA (cytidine1920-2'-O)/16S rRNA (cytidine1409-2'-O)-methyltransferase
VDSGLAPTRHKAQALILAGRVEVDGRRIDKPGHQVRNGDTIVVRPGARPYASRGGEKLAGVLDDLGVETQGLRCLDVGASTGGFTDVLLRRDASHVTALDVGRGLLDAALRQDPRVTVVEGVNARHLDASQVCGPFDLVTADVSFISLTLILPRLLPLAPQGLLLCLVKPQFELSPREVGRGGVVRDPLRRAQAVERVALFLIQHCWGILAVRASPLAGPKGNREIFLLARRGAGLGEDDWRESLAREVRRGEA